MRYPESKLRDEISMADQRIARTEETAADLDESDRPFTGTYHFRVSAHRQRAILSLLIGDIEEARHHFADMARAHFDYVAEIAAYPDETAHGGGHKVRPTRAREGLEAALLADDTDLIERGIGACRALPESYPDEHEPVEIYWRTRAFAEVVAESDAVEELLAQYESARYDAVDDGWLDVLHGLHETDRERVTDGLYTLLDEWADEAPLDITNAETVLDVDTTALFALARRRGLDVQVAHDRVPDAVENSYGDSEWDRGDRYVEVQGRTKAHSRLREKSDTLRRQQSHAITVADAADAMDDEMSDGGSPSTGRYLFPALRSKDAGKYSILLEETDTAVEYFTRMGRARLEYASELAAYPGESQEPRPENALKGLEAAVLVDDGDLLARGIDACRSLPKSYPEEYEPVETYWRARAFAEVVGDSDAVDELLAQYEAVSDDAVDDGWLDVLYGLEETGAERITAGLYTLAEAWAADTRLDVSDPETLLDVDTAALYVLARRRGLDVRVPHERFPTQIDDLVSF